jgi:hypothetical protein
MLLIVIRKKKLAIKAKDKDYYKGNYRSNKESKRTIIIQLENFKQL